MLTSSAEGSRTYDLCINVAGRRLFWRNPNHGVTLGNNTIAWIMDDGAWEMEYRDIVAVNLNSAGQEIPVDRCTITFADGSGLLIVNTDPGGYRDAECATRYRDFVHDLHARLACGRYPEIRFTAGVPRWRYLVMLGSAIAAAPVFALAGLGGYLFYHLSNGLVLLVVGEYFCWSLGRRALANAPRHAGPTSRAVVGITAVARAPARLCDFGDNALNSHSVPDPANEMPAGLHRLRRGVAASLRLGA
jgi:hypothetical protein